MGRILYVRRCRLSGLVALTPPRLSGLELVARPGQWRRRSRGKAKSQGPPGFRRTQTAPRRPESARVPIASKPVSRTRHNPFYRIIAAAINMINPKLMRISPAGVGLNLSADSCIWRMLASARLSGSRSPCPLRRARTGPFAADIFGHGCEICPKGS